MTTTKMTKRSRRSTANYGRGRFQGGKKNNDKTTSAANATASAMTPNPTKKRKATQDGSSSSSTTSQRRRRADKKPKIQEQQDCSTAKNSVSSNNDQPQDDDGQLYNFEAILNHRKRKGERLQVEIQWSEGTIDWRDAAHIAEDVPEAVVSYAEEHNLLHKQEWKQFRKYVTKDKNDAATPMTTTSSSGDERRPEHEIKDDNTITTATTTTTTTTTKSNRSGGQDSSAGHDRRSNRHSNNNSDSSSNAKEHSAKNQPSSWASTNTTVVTPNTTGTTTTSDMDDDDVDGSQHNHGSAKAHGGQAAQATNKNAQQQAEPNEKEPASPLPNCNCKSCLFNNANGGPDKKPCFCRKGCTGTLDALQEGATYHVRQDILPKTLITKVPITVTLSNRTTTFNSLEDAVKQVFKTETATFRNKILRGLRLDLYHHIFGLRFRAKVTSNLVKQDIKHVWLGQDGYGHSLMGKIGAVERNLLSNSIVCQVMYRGGKTKEFPLAQVLGSLWDCKADEKKKPGVKTHRIIPMQVIVPTPLAEQSNREGWIPVGIFKHDCHCYKLELKQMDSMIENAGSGVFIRAEITRGEARETCTHLELSAGTLIDLGIFGCGQEECNLTNPVYTAKAYIFGGKNQSYAMARGSHGDVVDVTNESSEVLPEAAANLLPYINEVSGSLSEDEIVKKTNIVTLFDPEDMPHLYLGNQQYPLRISLSEPTELLTDYGTSYNKVRSSKGYQRLTSEQVACEDDCEAGASSLINQIGDWSFEDLKHCTEYVHKNLPISTMRTEELHRALEWTDRLHKVLVKMMSDGEFSHLEKNPGFQETSVLELLLQTSETRSKLTQTVA